MGRLSNKKNYLIRIKDYGEDGCMPDVTNDERGRRLFQLHKERACEAAMEKIRAQPEIRNF